MNTQKINKITENLYNNQFEDVYTLLDDLLFVNLDFLTNRDYQFEGVNEFQLSVAELGHNKTIVFLLRDGLNPYLTPMKLLIEHTVQIHNLNADTCFLIGYHNLHIKNTTTIYYDAAEIWANQVYQLVKEIPISDNSFHLRFAALFGRHDAFRLKICRYLYENYRNQSLLSYNSSRIDYNHRFTKYFADDYAWAKNHCPILLDFDQPAGWVYFQDSLTNIHKHYQKYFVEIVVETDPHTDNFFTEKTLKNFYLGKPFLLLSGPGSLKYLHSMGFKTFESEFDESYDTEPSIAKRLAILFKEIDRLANLTVPQLAEMHTRLRPIFEHNRQRFQAKGQNAVGNKIITN